MMSNPDDLSLLRDVGRDPDASTFLSGAGQREDISQRAITAEQDQETRTDKKNKTHQDEHDEEDREKDDGKKDKGSDDGKKKSRWPLIILAAIVIVAIIGGVIYWFMTRDLETTSDAYTEGNAISIAPKVSGYVVERHVNDNTFVKAGDLMIKIDPRDYITARDQARGNLTLARAQLASAQVNLQIAKVRAPANLQQSQAQLAQSRASLTDAERNYKRQHGVDPRATTQTNIDQANTQLQSNSASVRSAQAQVQISGLVQQNIETAEASVKQQQGQVEQAEANLAQAELNLGYTELRAPQDGYITNRNVDVGTYAQAGQQLFYLVAPDTWIVANFKENQLARMHPGQEVSISVDAYPTLKLHGHVQSVQQGSGARFSTFPAENATGNFVKIVRRVPVKIIVDRGIDQNQGLPLGISVEPTVTLK